MNDFAVDPRVLGPIPVDIRLIRFAIDSLTPAEVPDDIARETRAISFSDFVREAWHTVEGSNEYVHNWHIDAIGVFLEKIESGEITRAVINLPPRHMKSLLVSVFWPCWLWTRQPGIKFLFGSYSSTLAKMHSVFRRQVIQSPWYQSHWGHIVRLLSDTNRQDEFANTAQGRMVATSVRGSSTGKGANIIVIDDPHDPHGAASPAERQEALTWIDQTIQNRLNNDRGKIVFVMQRLHEQDATGHVLSQPNSQYVRLKIPAIEEVKAGEPQQVYEMPGGVKVVRKPGTALWPKQFGIKFLRGLEATMLSGFAGQYQQEPTGKTGSTFRVENLREWSEFRPGHPDYERKVKSRVRSWDIASTENDGDYTVGLRMALLEDGRFVIEDVFRDRLEPDDVDKSMVLISKLDRSQSRAPYAVREEQEPGSSGKTVVKLRARQGLIGFDYQGVRSDADKVTRARPLASAMRMGLVYLVAAPWNAAFKEELRLFPRGSHDDQVDGASGAYNHLAELVIGNGGSIEVKVTK
jgi:predicted phage terminase large subunit-like protein